MLSIFGIKVVEFCLIVNTMQLEFIIESLSQALGAKLSIFEFVHENIKLLLFDSKAVVCHDKKVTSMNGFVFSVKSERDRNTWFLIANYDLWASALHGKYQSRLFRFF